jgi:hypothetical protein
MEIFNILRSTRKVILDFYLRLFVLRICRKVWAYEYSLLEGCVLLNRTFTLHLNTYRRLRMPGHDTNVSLWEVMWKITTPM